VTPTQREAALKHAQQLSLDAILSGLDVWTAVKGRMRDNAHAQVLLEMAVVRLARMDELLAVGQLASALGQGRIVVPAQSSGTPRAPAAANEATEGAKKNDPVTPDPAASPDAPAPSPTTVSLNESTLPAVWGRINRHLAEKSPMLASHLRFARLPAIFGPNILVIRFQSEYNHAYDVCDAEENIHRIEEALLKECGRPITVSCEIVIDRDAGPTSGPAAANGGPRVLQASDRRKQLMGLPLFRKAGEALGAQIWHVDDDFNPVAPAQPTNNTDPDREPDEI
jgi:DNA polymerase-3 subunit gamma/tau